LAAIGKIALVNEKKDSIILLASVSISLGTGIISSWCSPGMRMTYEMMYKPDIAPPGWVFGPVWAFLYILMGISAYRVFVTDRDRAEARDALFYYGSQLVLNAMWPVLFFRFSLEGTALLDVITLAVLVFITTVKFSRIDAAAGWLMIPYLLWVIYSGVLNYAIVSAGR
jgi:benzodiazapine receptor